MNAQWLILAAIVAVNLAVLPYFLFLLATALAAILTGRRQPESRDPSSKFLIVIPAHDEESGIATTVRSCHELELPVVVLRRRGHRRQLYGPNRRIGPRGRSPGRRAV